MSNCADHARARCVSPASKSRWAAGSVRELGVGAHAVDRLQHPVQDVQPRREAVERVPVLRALGRVHADRRAGARTRPGRGVATSSSAGSASRWLARAYACIAVPCAMPGDPRRRAAAVGEVVLPRQEAAAVDRDRLQVLQQRAQIARRGGRTRTRSPGRSSPSGWSCRPSPGKYWKITRLVPKRSRAPDAGGPAFDHHSRLRSSDQEHGREPRGRGGSWRPGCGSSRSRSRARLRRWPRRPRYTRCARRPRAQIAIARGGVDRVGGQRPLQRALDRVDARRCAARWAPRGPAPRVPGHGTGQRTRSR